MDKSIQRAEGIRGAHEKYRKNRGKKTETRRQARDDEGRWRNSGHQITETGTLMQFYGKRTLFLGAHPDDIELGCGALIHHIRSISDVLCVTLSDNQKNPLLKNVVEEHFRSMEILGVPKDKVILGEFTTRIFHDSR